MYVTDVCHWDTVNMFITNSHQHNLDHYPKIHTSGKTAAEERLEEASDWKNFILHYIMVKYCYVYLTSFIRTSRPYFRYCWLQTCGWYLILLMFGDFFGGCTVVWINQYCFKCKIWLIMGKDILPIKHNNKEKQQIASHEYYL